MLLTTADGGVEYRPVVELNIELNGKKMSRVLFNLNNRDKMEYPCLIGQNVLEKSGFLVDPNMNGPVGEADEDGWIPDNVKFAINYKALTEEFSRGPKVSDDDVDGILKMMVEGNMTIPDLVRYIRSDAVSALNETKP